MVGQGVQEGTTAATADEQLIPLNYRAPVLHPADTGEVDQVPLVGADYAVVSHGLVALLVGAAEGVNDLPGVKH